ncbi:MAG: Trm112 family protein [Candidatus Dormibacteria bacterium]
MKPLPPGVRRLLACPRCHGELVDDESGLRCDACALLYPIVDGLPVLLVDEATPAQRPR